MNGLIEGVTLIALALSVSYEARKGVADETAVDDARQVGRVEVEEIQARAGVGSVQNCARGIGDGRAVNFAGEIGGVEGVMGITQAFIKSFNY